MAAHARCAAIPFAWGSITGMWSAGASLELLREINDRGVDPHDYPAVRKVWLEMSQDAKSKLDAISIEAQAAALLAAARSAEVKRIEGLMPHIRRNPKGW